MAADLAATPATGLVVQAAATAIASTSAASPRPSAGLPFDINDFDETAVASWEWI